jgi:hypothetical protein
LCGEREKGCHPPPGDRPREKTAGVKFLGDWANATRGDLVLFRKAIKEDWPVPLERRGPLIEVALSPISRKDRSCRLAPNAFSGLNC